MVLPTIDKLDIYGKRVLVRLDLDTNPDPEDLRIKASEETLDYLKQKNCKITIIAHKGRPQGVEDKSLSLKPFQTIFDKWGAEVLENLRFDPREETNDESFAKELAQLGDFYVNEAFGASHREHASIVGISKFLPHAAGFRFAKEVENLSKVLEKPIRPVVMIISGIKKDKVEMIENLKGSVDKVLVAGRLPELFNENYHDEKVLIAQLNPDKEDVTVRTIETFEGEIKKAGTIVLAGVIGKYEDQGHRLGTQRIFNAVANSSAFKVAGGGDTEIAIGQLSLINRFNWISVGGGAMLEFLAKGTLPGIEALLA